MHISNKNLSFRSLRVIQPDENQIQYFAIRCQMDLSAGSEDSLLFLRNYQKSEFTEFLFSPWRFIIDDKWSIFQFFYYIQALFFWAMTALICYFFFNPVSQEIVLTIVVLIAVNLAYETFILVIDFFNYIRNPEKYFVLAAQIAAITIMFITKQLHNSADETNLLILRSLQCGILAGFFYRSLTFLKAIGYLRHIIAMLMAITVDIVDILIVIAIVILFFATLMAKSNKNIKWATHLYYTFFSFYGQIEYTQDVLKGYLDTTLMVVLCFILPLIMFNFLIARMSNKYSYLENQQKALHYKSKAKIITEFENIIHKFRTRKQIKSSELNSHRRFMFLAINNDEFDTKNEDLNLLSEIRASNSKLNQIQEALADQMYLQDNNREVQKRIITKLNTIDKHVAKTEITK